jgi:hypothetical protein
MPPMVTQTPPGVAPTTPGVAQMLPGVAQTLPGVALTLPGVTQTPPGVAETPPRVAHKPPGVAQTPPGVAHVGWLYSQTIFRLSSRRGAGRDPARERKNRRKEVDERWKAGDKSCHLTGFKPHVVKSQDSREFWTVKQVCRGMTSSPTFRTEVIHSLTNRVKVGTEPMAVPIM